MVDANCHKIPQKRKINLSWFRHNRKLTWNEIVRPCENFFLEVGLMDKQDFRIEI